MCGIAGIVFNDTTRPSDELMLRRMTDIMRHRGPDSKGFHLGPGVGLGMCRLSIIDTTTGDQPIANEDSSVVVICNGEIYNYVELREQLLAKGHRFRSNSDVEVIAHLYEDDPDGFVEQLRGMFAVALWDANRRRLILVRDRFGIKPLHYAVTAKGLVFGSELKTVLASGVLTATLDRAALRDAFTLGYVRAPRSMAAGVQRLLPGQLLVFNAGQVTKRLYWDVSFPDNREYDQRTTADEWAQALRAKLTESVRLHLRSDVPVGAWLSGGIDSSAVAALMHGELRRPIPTFTLGFENASVDELKSNRLLDEYLEFELVGHRTECRREHFELLPRAVWHREQPFGLGVDISRLLIAELSARHVKVVLCGEGADEALGGYTWYRADKLLARFTDWPLPLRELAAGALRGRWPGAANILLTPSAMNLQRIGVLFGGAANGAAINDLLANNDGETTEEFVLPPAFRTWHRFAQLQYFDFKLRLAESVVQHLDLLSMAHSLEARVPFLDHPLVEFCATIPPWIKMRGLREKDVLRRAMRNVLPREICRRRKFPLSAPTRDWMRGALPEFAADTLTDGCLRATGLFQPNHVAALVAEHRDNKIDRSSLLMKIVTTQLWDGLFRKRFSCVTP